MIWYPPSVNRIPPSPQMIWSWRWWWSRKCEYAKRIVALCKHIKLRFNYISWTRAELISIKSSVFQFKGQFTPCFFLKRAFSRSTTSTYEWYCACRKLNSSLILSSVSAIVNFMGPCGGGPCKWKREEKRNYYFLCFA